MTWYDPAMATTAGGAVAAGSLAARADTPEGKSARGVLEATLRQYGLPASLVDRLWNEEYINKGTPIQTVLDLVLPNTEEFKARFPGLTQLTERRNKGEAVQVPTVAEYVALETGIAGVLRDAGLPANFYDSPDDFGKWIGGSTSPKEVEDRIALARTVAFSMPVETREELNRLYDLDEGELIAFVIDPERALPEVQKRVLAGGISGASRRVGYGLLTAAEAEQLAASSVTEAEAEERFGTLAQVGEGLFAETAGEAAAGEDLNRGTQLAFATGSAEAERQMTQRRRRRAAQFEGGGGAATGGAGTTGLG